MTMAVRRLDAGLRSLGLALTVLVLSVAACGGTTPSQSGGQPSASADGSSTPGPKPTNWPTGVVEAAIALGAADGDFARVGLDLETAVTEGDLEALLTVVTDVIEFIEGNQPNVVKLQGYEGTKALGDALAPTYATMLEGVTKIRDSLLAGDADGVEAGFTAFVEGTIAYSQLRNDVNEAAVTALFMKRQLLR